MSTRPRHGWYAPRPSLLLTLWVLMGGVAGLRDGLGSHKCCYPLPHSIRTANHRTPIRHLTMDNGDLLFFLGGTVIHGAYRWEGDEPRRTALFSYEQPRGSAGRLFQWPAGKL